MLAGYAWRTMFLDEVKITVEAGDGGAGVVAFRREKYVPFGGPAGGDGGHGGMLVLVVNPRLNTLSNFQRKRHFKALNGSSGSNFNRTGASAPDLELEVAPGTIVRDESSQIIADLTLPGQRAIVTHGGRGGRGNARFKSATNQAPRVAEKGEPGEQRAITLELKLIADVGIVGVPNAGKSTLLSVISAAKPRIADYPFTTLAPNLGVSLVNDREIVFADVPGLVEGAHQGIGLGHDFLRHIQRTRLLIHLLDGAQENALGDFVQTSSELALFDKALAEKPQLVVLNKIDLPSAKKQATALRGKIKDRGYGLLLISAVTHEGIQEVLNMVARRLDEMPVTQPEIETPVFRPPEDDEKFQIVRDGAIYRVTGKRIERAAAMTYWEFEEAVERFQQILYALGIADALSNAGAKKGDIVCIGDHELEWAE